MAEIVTRPYERAFENHGLANPEVLCLSADLTSSCEIDRFRDAHPDRFLRLGMAEQNMISFAGGLALAGFRPFVHSFGVFLYRRPYDQLIASVAYRQGGPRAERSALRPVPRPGRGDHRGSGAGRPGNRQALPVFRRAGRAQRRSGRDGGLCSAGRGERATADAGAVRVRHGAAADLRRSDRPADHDPSQLPGALCAVASDRVQPRHDVRHVAAAGGSEYFGVSQCRRAVRIFGAGLRPNRCRLRRSWPVRVAG